MNEMNRDSNIIFCMADWCGQIRQAHERFGGSRACFLNDTVYRNAVSMCLFQICELAGHLSDEFRAEHPDLPWTQIRGMRNLFAHNYGGMDADTIWQTLIEDVPVIETFCKKQRG